jgi:conserved oligomeric Golgi complex subunit 3
MIKNLLIVKNELVSLEIGDVRSQTAANMQHFGQIWDTLSPQNWMGLFRGILGGSLSLGIWSSAPASASSKPFNAKDGVQDASEKLDELLRQSIYAFTQRWGGMVNAASSDRSTTKTLTQVEKELDEKLLAAFGGQPEVIGKLKEAIQINAQAQKEAADTKR